jgi:hypothetical protein
MKLNTTRAINPDSVKQCLAAFERLLGSGAEKQSQKRRLTSSVKGLPRLGTIGASGDRDTRNPNVVTDVQYGRDTGIVQATATIRAGGGLESVATECGLAGARY